MVYSAHHIESAEFVLCSTPDSVSGTHPDISVPYTPQLVCYTHLARCLYIPYTVLTCYIYRIDMTEKIFLITKHRIEKYLTNIN